MSFCKKCGNELNPGAKFCTKCGQIVPVPIAFSGVPNTTETPVKNSGNVYQDVKNTSYAENPMTNAASSVKKQFCKKCGSELNPGVKFCTKCGQMVSPPTASENIPNAAATPSTAYPGFGENTYGASRQNSQQTNSYANSMLQTESVGFFKRLGRKKVAIIASVLLVCVIGAAGAGIGLGKSNSGNDDPKVSETSKERKTPTSSSKHGAASIDELISILENNSVLSAKAMNCMTPVLFEPYYDAYIHKSQDVDLEALYGKSKVYGKNTAEDTFFDIFINAESSDIFDDMVQFWAAQSKNSESYVKSYMNNAGSIHIRQYEELVNEKYSNYYSFLSGKLDRSSSKLEKDVYNWYLGVDKIFTCNGYADLSSGTKSFRTFGSHDGQFNIYSFEFYFVILRKDGRYYWCPEYVSDVINFGM